MSTSGTVGTAEGEFVAAGEPSWTLPLQLCNSDMEKSAKELVSASTFKVVVKRAVFRFASSSAWHSGFLPSIRLR